MNPSGRHGVLGDRMLRKTKNTDPFKWHLNLDNAGQDCLRLIVVDVHRRLVPGWNLDPRSLVDDLVIEDNE
jgi:hypothetical protein